MSYSLGVNNFNLFFSGGGGYLNFFLLVDAIQSVFLFSEIEGCTTEQPEISTPTRMYMNLILTPTENVAYSRFLCHITLGFYVKYK